MNKRKLRWGKQLRQRGKKIKRIGREKRTKYEKNGKKLKNEEMEKYSDRTGGNAVKKEKKQRIIKR